MSTTTASGAVHGKHVRRVRGGPGNRLALDSMAIIGTSGLMALVGFVYWALAARLIPAQKLGVDTALNSLITTGSSIATVGVGNAFTAILPTAGKGRKRRVFEGYVIVLVLSTTIGVVVGILAVLELSISFPAPLVVGMVCVSTVIWSICVLQDSALTGSGRAIWLPPENVSISIARLALLPIFVASFAHAAVVASIVPALIAVVVISCCLLPRLLARPDAMERTYEVSSGRDLALFAARDGAASAMTLGVMLSLPFVVTALAGPKQGALFAVCLAVSQTLDIVTTGSGVSLTVHASQDLGKARSLAIRVWMRCAALVAVCALVLGVGAPLILRVFGPSYATNRGEELLRVLAAGALVRTLFVVWASLQRARRNTRVILTTNAISSIVSLPVIVVLTDKFGAIGAAGGLLCGSLLLSTVAAFDIYREGRRGA